MAKITGMVQLSTPEIATVTLPAGVVEAIYEPPPPTLFAVRAEGGEEPLDQNAEPEEKRLIFAIRKVAP